MTVFLVIIKVLYQCHVIWLFKTSEGPGKKYIFIIVYFRHNAVICRIYDGQIYEWRVDQKKPP